MSPADVHKPEPARVPPELLGSVPRDVRLTSGGMALVAVAVACVVGALAAAIVMSIAYIRVDAERRLRDRESVVADAEVVQVAVQRGEHPRRIVTYRYAVDGRSYLGRTTQREHDRRDLMRGTRIRIEYLRSQPEASWMAGDRPSGFPIWLIPLAALGLPMMGGFIARGIRRQWILLSEGRVAQARVTGFKKVHRDTGKAYKVSYEFKTLSGATHTSRSEVGKAPPAVGTVIPIVYHRDQPTWSAMYPLQLVRPLRRTQG